MFLRATARQLPLTRLISPTLSTLRPLATSAIPNDIKLTYFDIRGRGELSRLILNQAGVDFTDERIPLPNAGDAWGKMKSGTPFGHMPILTADGGKLVLSESGAVARYLANKTNLSGQTDEDVARADMFYETTADCKNKFTDARNEKDDKKRVEMMANFLEVFLPDYLGRLEKFMKQNGSGYLAGSSLTYADLAFFEIFFTVQQQIPPALEKCPPMLRSLYEKVSQLPNIKSWCEKRPLTEK